MGMSVEQGIEIVSGETIVPPVVIDKAVIEKAAEAIYNAFPYDGIGEKPAWVIGGNSLKQDEARKYAALALKAVHAPTVQDVRDAEDGWIVWNGGPNPLVPEVMHQRKYRDGQIGDWTNGRMAGDDHWEHSGGNADIIAYRVPREPK